MYYVHDREGKLWMSCDKIMRDLGKHKSLLVVCRGKIFCLTVGIREINGKWCAAACTRYSGVITKGQKLTHSCQNCYGNTYHQRIQTTSAGPLTVPLHVSLYLHFPPPAHRPHSSVPACSSFFISHHFSLAVSPNPSLSRLSVGGLHEKVVHFWICCFFEVQPSLLLCNLTFLSSVSPLICSPPLSFPCLYSSLSPPFSPSVLYFFTYQALAPRLHLVFFSISSIVSSSPLIE